MAEYINREKTKRELSEWCISLNSPHLLSRDDTMFLLDNIPAADVAPVVRCKDCLFWKSGKNECESWEWCTILDRDMAPHAFCNFGVRKDDDDSEPEE